METKFFMVFVEGQRTPTVKYADKKAAEKEAKRLANKLGKQAFVLESNKQVSPGEVNEVIDSYEAALAYLGRKDEACMCGVADKHAKAMSAMYRLITIAEAWNQADGFVPDYDNRNQYKWFPWFTKGAAGFVCSNTAYTATSTTAYFGSRLCFGSESRAKQFGKQFIDLWNDFLLFR